MREKSTILSLTSIFRRDKISKSYSVIILVSQLVSEKCVTMSMRKLYRKLSRKKGIPLKSLKSDMQQALDMAWQMPQDSSVREYQKSIPSKGAIPTPDEVILYSVQKARS